MRKGWPKLLRVQRRVRTKECARILVAWARNANKVTDFSEKLKPVSHWRARKGTEKQNAALGCPCAALKRMFQGRQARALNFLCAPPMTSIAKPSIATVVPPSGTPLAGALAVAHAVKVPETSLNESPLTQRTS